MTTLREELIEIGQKITEGTCTYGELAYLQEHKQAVLNMGDITLCEQAGITEEEYNKGELNPDLSYEDDFVKLNIDSDDEGNTICDIILDDGQHLTLTEPELLGLRRILMNNFSEIEEYFHECYEKAKSL